MKTFNIKLDFGYTVEAENEEEAVNKLAERFDNENITAENEFWDNLTVIEVKP